MRIANIKNNKGDNTYEVYIIGSEADINAYQLYTNLTADFVEEELNDEFSITIMSDQWASNKKEFRAEVVADLKEFRLTNKNK